MNAGLFVLALKVLEISSADEKETQERAASLVVLPPLVLGYEELYVDNDDKPAKKDMSYPDENEDIPEAAPKERAEERDEPAPFLDVVKDRNGEATTKIVTKTTTTPTTTTRRVTTTKTTTTKKVTKTKATTTKKKESKRTTTKTPSKKTTPKKNNKKNKDEKLKKKTNGKTKVKKSKKKGKRKGLIERTSESKSESNSDSQSDSSSDNLEASNETKSGEDHDVYGIERIHPSMGTIDHPIQSSRIPLSHPNIQLSLVPLADSLQIMHPKEHSVGSQANIVKDTRVTNKYASLINDKEYVVGTHLQPSKPPPKQNSKLVSLLSRRSGNSDAKIGKEKGVMRNSDEKGDKGIITLKGQGEIGEGKEVLEFTGNFRVPKKVLDCPCFREILENVKPAF